MKYLLITALLVFGITVFAEEGAKEEKKTDSTEVAPKADAKEKSAGMKLADMEFQKTKSGVEYKDFVVGTGKTSKMGSRVDCHYTVWIADENGEKKTRLQSSKDANKSFQCTLGYQVVQGWSDGMVGMQEGGTRLLRVAPALAWGARGMGKDIPPNSTVIFEIDLLTVIKE